MPHQVGSCLGLTALKGALAHTSSVAKAHTTAAPPASFQQSMTGKAPPNPALQAVLGQAHRAISATTWQVVIFWFPYTRKRSFSLSFL